MAAKQVINVPDGPPSHAYMSAAIRAGDFVFVSGNVGIKPMRPPHGEGGNWMPGELVEGGVEAETRRTLDNIRLILEAAGGSLADVVKINSYLRDIDRDFHIYNRVYQEYFPSEPPARTTIGAKIYGSILVEIEAVAYLPQQR